MGRQVGGYQQRNLWLRPDQIEWMKAQSTDLSGVARQAIDHLKGERQPLPSGAIFVPDSSHIEAALVENSGRVLVGEDWLLAAGRDNDGEPALLSFCRQDDGRCLLSLQNINRVEAMSFDGLPELAMLSTAIQEVIIAAFDSTKRGKTIARLGGDQGQLEIRPDGSFEQLGLSINIGEPQFLVLSVELSSLLIRAIAASHETREQLEKAIAAV